MDMLNQSGPPSPRRDVASHFFHVARASSIYWAIMFGGVFAFPMLSNAVASASVPSGALSLLHAHVADPAPSVAVDQLEGGTLARGNETDINDLSETGIRASEPDMPKGEVATDMEQAAIAWCGLLAFTFALTALTVISLGGWCRTRTARKVALVRARATESEWQRRYADVEAREQAVRTVENWTDPHEFVDEYVALFTSATVRKRVCLSVSINRWFGARVLTDSARLGQIVVHLLSRAVRSTEHGQPTVSVRAESINTGSQRLYIGVRSVASVERNGPIRSTHGPRSSSLDSCVAIDASHLDDASLTLCQQLASHTQGELKFETGAGLGGSTFSAPFAIECSPVCTMPECSSHEKYRQTFAAQLSERLDVPASESIDQSYLDALSNEGIDLGAFVRGLRQSMNDDLEQMRSLRASRDFDGLRSTLHRLSGAVGLVGACGLMGALQRASVAELEPEAALLDSLARLIEALMTQLDEALNPHRSGWQ
jgi:hypothetical protein